jgi:hypothetical protein
MRRLARHLFTLCATVSLVLCVAACVLWVWSYGAPRDFVVAGHYLISSKGQLEVDTRLARAKSRRANLQWQQASREAAVLVERAARATSPEDRAASERWAADAARRLANLSPPPPPVSLVRELRVSYAALLTATLAPPSGWAMVAILIRSQTRRRRQGAGLCVRCGYDLRASPDRCPECGTRAK